MASSGLSRYQTPMSHYRQTSTPAYITEPYHQKFKPSTPVFPHPPGYDSKRASKIDHNKSKIEESSDDENYTRDLRLYQRPQQNRYNSLDDKDTHQQIHDRSKLKALIIDCIRNESDEGER